MTRRERLEVAVLGLFLVTLFALGCAVAVWGP